MKLIITRIRGNKDATLGILSIKGSPFKCATLERRTPDYGDNVPAMARALPAGTYPMILKRNVTHGIFPTFKRMAGYGQPQFTNIRKVHDLPTGYIAIGTKHPDDFSIDGYEGPAAWIYDKVAWPIHMETRRNKKKPDFELEIKYADDFKFEETSYEDFLNAEFGSDGDFFDEDDEEEEDED